MGCAANGTRARLKGGPPSPLLANLLLDDLDQELELKGTSLLPMRRRLQHLCAVAGGRGASDGVGDGVPWRTGSASRSTGRRAPSPRSGTSVSRPPPGSRGHAWHRAQKSGPRQGHFGPELRRFVLMQYHQGQSTMPRLAGIVAFDGRGDLEAAIGSPVEREPRGVHRRSPGCSARRAGNIALGTVDDTGARHAGKNGFCTQIGNEWFTWFGTRSSKSRLNFLDLLRAGHTDYVLNDAAYGYMREHGLPAPLIARLEAATADAVRRSGRLAGASRPARLHRSLRSRPTRCRVATEGALWGSVQAHEFLCDAVVLSDDAGQFNIGRHALCWVHAERLVHKLDTFTDQHRAAQTRVRGLIWDFYADLKAYQLKPGKRRASALRARFDRIFLRRTGFVTLDRLLARLHANKAELLMVLERPEIPLHTNGSENDIRCHVTRRKVSAGTRSDIGRDCRDAFLGLAKTCDKLGIAVWDYLGSRLKVAGHAIIEPLDHYVRARLRPA